jgi:hypothetical protein
MIVFLYASNKMKTKINKSSKLIKFLESKTGSIAFSILLGFGIAALFKKACDDNKCIIIQSPDVNELNNYFYRTNNVCYKYTPVETKC